MEIKTDLFINEIEKRPAIWNMKSSEYSNRTNAWEELVLVFSNIEDTEDKKKNLGKQKLILKYVIDFISLQI
jgi:hypothetical protein